MFTKCANWNCPQAFCYSRSAIVFRIETRGGEGASLGEPPRGQADYHWLCAECLRVVLIALEDQESGAGLASGRLGGGGGKIVRLISLDAALAELAGRGESIRRMEQTRTLDCEEAGAGMLPTESVPTESGSGMPEFEVAVPGVGR